MAHQRVRYNIVVRSSQNGRRRRDFSWNREPLKPGAVAAAFMDAVDQQYGHLSFEGKYRNHIRGLDLRGTMVPDDTGVIERPGSVWMWGMGTAMVITVLRA
jgi:hypothetical protein